MLYKFRFCSVHSLAKDLQKNVDSLNEPFDHIDKLRDKLKDCFESLKKVAPGFNKLQVQVSELKEYDPKLQNLYEESEHKSSELNNFIFHTSSSLLSEFDVCVKLLKKITFDADTIFFKENKVLDGFARKIKCLKGDQKLANSLLTRINGVKMDMKSVARKLFEASRAEEDSIIEVRSRLPIVDELKKLGVAIDDIGRILVSLNIDNIEDIVSKSEKLLENVKKVELQAILSLAKLEKILLFLENKLFLLDKVTYDKVQSRILSSRKLFDRTRHSITKSAESLFKDIKILE